MNLLQRFCSAVIDASDTFGASMEGVDIRTHRENLYGHPDGIVAAREAGASPRVQVEAGSSAQDVAHDLACGPEGHPGIALPCSSVMVRARVEGARELEEQARWRDNFGRDSLTGF
jgi:hypothetical protein